MNAKLVVVGIALVGAWLLFGKQVQAAISQSFGDNQQLGELCVAPAAPCSWNTAKCCTPCAAIPGCNVSQTDGGSFDPTDGDGPVTQPSQTDISGGPIVSPDQV